MTAKKSKARRKPPVTVAGTAADVGLAPSVAGAPAAAMATGAEPPQDRDFHALQQHYFGAKPAEEVTL